MGPRVLSALCRFFLLPSHLISVIKQLPLLQARGVMGAEPAWPLLLDVVCVPRHSWVRNQRQRGMVSCSWRAAWLLQTPAPHPRWAPTTLPGLVIVLVSHQRPPGRSFKQAHTPVPLTRQDSFL